MLSNARRRMPTLALERFMFLPPSNYQQIRRRVIT
jgi:hypothetical protein